MVWVLGGGAWSENGNGICKLKVHAHHAEQGLFSAVAGASNPIWQSLIFNATRQNQRDIQDTDVSHRADGSCCVSGCGSAGRSGWWWGVCAGA